MDHITQLYQNRAKVLQEEVTRLEALLEAVKDIELGNTEDVSVSSSREISASAAGSEKKKEPVASVYGQPVSAEDIAQQEPIKNALYTAATVIPFTAASALLADFMGGKVGRIAAKAGENFPATSKIVKSGLEYLPAARKAREAAEKADELLTDNQIKIMTQHTSNIPPGTSDAKGNPIRSSTATGGILSPVGQALGGEAAEKITGQSLTPKARQAMTQLRSIGAITPEDIAAVKQGAKDIAMTGKEVGKRTSDLARGALGAAGKGLKIVDAITDPLSAAGEAIGLSSLSAVAPEVVGGLALAPLAIGAFTSEAGKGSDIVAPTEEEIKAREDWAKEQRKQQGLAPVDSITSPTSAVDAASLGAVTVSQQDRAKLERQAMGAKTSTPNLDRIQKQREMLKMLQSGPRMFGGGVK